MISTYVGVLKPNIVTSKSETNAAIEVAGKYFFAATTMVIMDPCKPEALMRLAASVSLNGLSTKADTLVKTTSSPDFDGKEFVMANSFYKDCKSAHKLAIRVDSEQRNSTT